MDTPRIIELNNERLLTTEQLAEFYGASETQIKTNFNRNKDKFIERKHYYRLEGQELKDFKNRVTDSNLVGKNASVLILWTKRGASRHSKMLGTDRAWNMYDELEENYFNKQFKLPTSKRELALLALSANEETNERVDVIEKEVADLKNNQKIDAGDYSYLSRRVHQRVAEVAKGFGKITKEQRSKLYKDINSGIKQITGVGSRSQLREKHYETVIEYINDWEPSTATKTVVRQMSLDLNDVI
ncbi:TPA: ORF6C domain-containing protein [Enterococcus faecalis]|uniref:ORF6N domain-containing protein n=1 Tax=Enterococcus faecalis TaxID=1351 RepID=UPI0019264C3B|nr:ORF6C domain-containing protein [Enterococcus faecalis]HBC2896132.1 ORF6C domain-containing protein [Enterococcus faecalis]HDP1317448.1 ORF6C domain-containing protein [Enterococcus faecalis]